MPDKTSIRVEIAYANAERQCLIAIETEPGTTIETAIDRSGILLVFPEIDLMKQKVGVFSKLKRLTDCVQEGDRIEIYRPLQIDPKTARKNRAK